jgi:hypothetical protein
MIKPRTTIDKFMMWIAAFFLVAFAVALAAVIMLEIGGK